MQTGYYLGLDIGSNSVGYAVTDENYVINPTLTVETTYIQ